MPVTRLWDNENNFVIKFCNQRRSQVEVKDKVVSTRGEDSEGRKEGILVSGVNKINYNILRRGRIIIFGLNYHFLAELFLHIHLITYNRRSDCEISFFSHFMAIFPQSVSLSVSIWTVKCGFSSCSSFS